MTYLFGIVCVMNTHNIYIYTYIYIYSFYPHKKYWALWSIIQTLNRALVQRKAWYAMNDSKSNCTNQLMAADEFAYIYIYFYIYMYPWNCNFFIDYVSITLLHLRLILWDLIRDHCQRGVSIKPSTRQKKMNLMYTMPSSIWCDFALNIRVNILSLGYFVN